MPIVRWSDVRGITFREADSPYLERGYVHLDGHRRGTVLWNVSFVHHALRQLDYKQPINKFMHVWGSLLLGFHFLTADDVIFNGRRRNGDNEITSHLFSTTAIMLLFAVMSSHNAVKPRVKVAVRYWFATMIRKVTLAHQRRSITVSIVVAGVRVIISPMGGIISGWRELVSSLNLIAREVWRERVIALGSEDLVGLADILLFAAFLAKWPEACPTTRDVAKAILFNFATSYLAPGFEYYVLEVYGSMRNLAMLPRVLRGNGRSVGAMDPAVAFSTLERSRLVARCSPATIVGAKCDEAHLQDLSIKNASRWATVELAIYEENNHERFSPCSKFMLAGDPSTYHGEETMIGVIWSWEVGAACVCLAQKISSTRVVLDGDWDMADSLMAEVRHQKAQRLSALKEWQAISAMLYNSTGKRLSDMIVPETCDVRPVGPDETRIVDTSDERFDKEYIVNNATGHSRRVLPDAEDPGVWPQLTVGMDSGAIGRAGGFFAIHHLCVNMFIIFDKIHRAIRDLKLATSHAMNGLIHRALLHSSYIWSLNCKPYNSGAWWEVKKGMLEAFRQAHNYCSPLFRRYAHLYAKDIGLTLSSDDDYMLLWDRMVEAPGFLTKLEPVKLARWFSANARHDAEKCAFWVLKMVLAFDVFGHAAVDQPFLDYEPTLRSPSADMRDLRSAAAGGGFKLAERLLTPWLHAHIRIYYYGTKSTWSWYDQQCDKYKSPQEGILFFLRMSQGNWIREIEGIIDNCYNTPSHLLDIGINWFAVSADIDRQQGHA